MRQQERQRFKAKFKRQLSGFVENLRGHISTPDDQWTIKGFIGTTAKVTMGHGKQGAFSSVGRVY